MNETPDFSAPVYESAAGFDSERIHAAAVYCSDGRFGEPFDDFLYNGLGLPRYDRLSVPGGPACLAGHFDAWREAEAALNQLRFLIDVHGLERVILIAHEGCAFYTDKLKLSSLGLEDRQRDDLLKAAEKVQEIDRRLAVQAFLARRDDGVVRFEPVR